MDPRLTGLTHIFLDADDTLWENDIYFRKAEAEFVDYMSRFTTPERASKLLAYRQEENIPIFGYGSKTYFFGMMDAARDICPDVLDERMYADIKQIIVRLTTHPFDFLPGAETTVRELSKHYKVIIATKGELAEQLRKFHQSGLEDCVHAIEVMERKSAGDYLNLAEKVGVKPENMLMVGNAVRSDIAPVIEIGGWAVHIPYKITWEHEMMDLPVSDRIFQRRNISDLLGLLV